MAEALTKKKRIRAGQKASASKLLTKIEETTALESPETSKLSLLKMSLTEKLTTSKQLDGEIVELIDDERTPADEILTSRLIQGEHVLGHD